MNSKASSKLNILGGDNLTASSAPEERVLVSFLLTLLLLPEWIKICRRVGLLWEDMNKFKHPKNVAASGGVVVVMAFVLGVLTYIALKTFVFGGTVRALEIFALLSVILIFLVVISCIIRTGQSCS